MRVREGEVGTLRSLFEVAPEIITCATAHGRSVLKVATGGSRLIERRGLLV